MSIYPYTTYKRTLSWLHSDDEPRVQERQHMKDQLSYMSVFIAYLTYSTFSFFIQHLPRHDKSSSCMAVWQIYRYRATLRKKLHRTNQGSNFVGGNFSNRDYVRAPILFRRERQPQHLKRWFFLKNRPIHFHINSASVIRAVKRNKLSFSSIEIKKPLPAPVHSISQIRFKFSGHLQLLPQIRHLFILRVQCSTISIDSNITDGII